MYVAVEKLFSVIFGSLLSKILPDWHEILKRIYAIKEQGAGLGG
jgi:hypothetical protein